MRDFHVKVTLAGIYTFIKTVTDVDALVAVQNVDIELREGNGITCDIRAEIVDAPSPIEVEVEDCLAKGFRFTARSGNKVTAPAGYTEVAFIDGFVVASAYFGSEFFHLVPIPVELHMLMISACAKEDVEKVFGSVNEPHDYINEISL